MSDFAETALEPEDRDEDEDEQDEEEQQQEEASAGEHPGFDTPREVATKPRKGARRARGPRSPAPDRRQGVVQKTQWQTTIDAEQRWPEVLDRLAKQGSGPEDYLIRVKRISPGASVVLQPPIEASAVSGDVSQSPSDALVTYIEDFYHSKTAPGMGPATYTLEVYSRRGAPVNFATMQLRCQSIKDIAAIRNGLMERGLGAGAEVLPPIPRQPHGYPPNPYQQAYPPNPYQQAYPPNPYASPFAQYPYPYALPPPPRGPQAPQPAPTRADDAELVALRQQLRIAQERAAMAEERAAMNGAGALPVTPQPPAPPTIEQLLIRMNERLERLERGDGRLEPTAPAGAGAGAPPPAPVVATDFRTNIRAFSELGRAFSEARAVADTMHAFFYPGQQQEGPSAPAPEPEAAAAEPELERRNDIVISDLGLGSDGRRRQIVRNKETGDVSIAETLMANDWLIEMGMKHFGGTANEIVKRVMGIQGTGTGAPPTGEPPAHEMPQGSREQQQQEQEQQEEEVPSSEKKTAWDFG